MDEAMNELAAVVSSPAFKDKQVAFFEKYCNEFDGSMEENKLAYTTIHKQYEQDIEKSIEEQLGTEKLQMLCAGVEDYCKTGKASQSEAVMEAVDILTSLGDFESFKQTMLAKAAAMRDPGNMGIQDVKGVLEIESVMDRTADLRVAATEADGWNVVLDEPGLIMAVKPKPDSTDTYMRYTITLDLPPDQAYHMFTDFSPQSVAWRDKMANIETVRDNGPDDQIVSYSVAVPWALKYIMSIPEKMTVRILSRRNWPELNNYAYAAVPFDLENNLALEEMGMLKIKTGVVSPHPTDPQKCTVNGMDLANLSYMPSWGLGYVMKKMLPPMLAGQVEKYKATMKA
eukprot:gnl/TRDRNA2_/TRDRNA2_86970_c0_seq2.p1 gnl/TRDRNA2_/TRDRNA2_86970_c0~~gnl/TRDRNA2_/TRDRNA2_86970_c0_seq2.p1  ORF type:complete len:342 (+),score=66.98 gnl/TRDRNA2_/TRDRNA2_86970_c0_seq2:92-1117(+)